MGAFFERLRFKIFLFFAVASSLFADNPLTLFKIDPTTRGPEITSIVAMFNAPPYFTKLSEVAIQTGSGFIVSPAFAPLVVGGMIPYVQSAASSPNGTLLTVTYLPNGSSTKNQYLIVPIEKMAAVMFSPKPIRPPSPITSTYPGGELPRYDVDPALRAADLETVFHDFKVTLLKEQAQSTIGIFTTLSGPFNPPIFGGFIPNVQRVTASGAYLTIVYFPFSSNGRTYHRTDATIIVTAEQVIQMVYYANRLYSAYGR